MNNHAKVSVVMPAYNAELFIEDSIRSVIRQTFQEWEQIVFKRSGIKS